MKVEPSPISNDFSSSKTTVASDLFTLIAPSFDLTTSEQMSMEAFHQLLTHRIAHLLDHDLNMLMHLLYRIDVHEADVKRILMLSLPSEIASDLATLILERLSLKLKYRRQYRNEMTTDWWNEVEL